MLIWHHTFVWGIWRYSKAPDISTHAVLWLCTARSHNTALCRWHFRKKKLNNRKTIIIKRGCFVSRVPDNPFNRNVCSVAGSPSAGLTIRTISVYADSVITPRFVDTYSTSSFSVALLISLLFRSDIESIKSNSTQHCCNFWQKRSCWSPDVASIEKQQWQVSVGRTGYTYTNKTQLRTRDRSWMGNSDWSLRPSFLQPTEHRLYKKYTRVTDRARKSHLAKLTTVTLRHVPESSMHAGIRPFSHWPLDDYIQGWLIKSILCYRLHWIRDHHFHYHWQMGRSNHCDSHQLLEQGGDHYSPWLIMQPLEKGKQSCHTCLKHSKVMLSKILPPNVFCGHAEDQSCQQVGCVASLTDRRSKPREPIP